MDIVEYGFNGPNTDNCYAEGLLLYDSNKFGTGWFIWYLFNLGE